MIKGRGLFLKGLRERGLPVKGKSLRIMRLNL